MQTKAGLRRGGAFLELALNVLMAVCPIGGYLAPTRYPKRHKTKLIVVHILKDMPETITESDLSNLFLGFGLPIMPFHFVVAPNGDIEDGRDVTVVGGYQPDTLDIVLLCEDAPSSVQKSSLHDLIAALMEDFPWLERPEVKVVAEEHFRRTAIA